MKTTINEDGLLTIEAENGIESFAMDEWVTKNINPCSGQFICDNPYNAMQLYPYKRKRITLFHRIWVQIQLFFYR